METYVCTCTYIASPSIVFHKLVRMEEVVDNTDVLLLPSAWANEPPGLFCFRQDIEWKKDLSGFPTERFWFWRRAYDIASDNISVGSLASKGSVVHLVLARSSTAVNLLGTEKGLLGDMYSGAVQQQFKERLHGGIWCPVTNVEFYKASDGQLDRYCRVTVLVSDADLKLFEKIDEESKKNTGKGVIESKVSEEGELERYYSFTGLSTTCDAPHTVTHKLQMYLDSRAFEPRLLENDVLKSIDEPRVVLDCFQKGAEAKATDAGLKVLATEYAEKLVGAVCNIARTHKYISFPNSVFCLCSICRELQWRVYILLSRSRGRVVMGQKS